MTATNINDREFAQFQSMLYNISGISLSESKKPLVVSRLARRLREYELGSFTEYLKLLASAEYPDELQVAVDLLTTNETYFFREPNHFEFLRQHANNARLNGSPYRVWSAACSSGQEPYSIAMVLEDCLGNRNWEVLGSDISTHVLAKAQQALYPIAQADNISQHYLSRFCLKGVGAQAGSFLIERTLREKVNFFHANLNTELPRVGEFDLIFLRNVMIYFDIETKREVVQRLQSSLKRGGYFLIGHSESLNGVNDHLKMVAPSIFRKP